MGQHYSYMHWFWENALSDLLHKAKCKTCTLKGKADLIANIWKICYVKPATMKDNVYFYSLF